ncbi:nucleoside phosphorylase [Flectobacillus sp. DC10W]|uniref:Uridine phosphorylase n=1 Tax=Flectobacillus longus TaxID=2984207 RepID=A0ABT6YHQ7_9BACT|nr:nucleoside phosphorylase [Flectobacillus longus]MDI9863102.1 nucleoside phosphorylase [Flectobacillus longus]
MKSISETDLILNPDGSIYHLNLRPEDIANTIITVGDPNRVEVVSKYFDKVEKKVSKREFVTHTGYLGSTRITVISSGIGTDNVEILMNELDALVNVDLPTRTTKQEHTSLNIIRIGTSGSLQESIPVDSYVVSKRGIGFDALGHFYPTAKSAFSEAIQAQMNLDFLSYTSSGSQKLYDLLFDDKNTLYFEGNTVTCPGFYAPQGRVLRYNPKQENLLQKFNQFSFQGNVLTNLEMETAGYYLFGELLGHEVLSMSAIVASRMTHQFSKNPEKHTESLIQQVLEKITRL